MPLSIDRLLRNVVQISTEQLGALDVVGLVEFLVDGMSGIRGTSHWQQKNVLSGGLFEGQCDGDTVASYMLATFSVLRIS